MPHPLGGIPPSAVGGLATPATPEVERLLTATNGDRAVNEGAAPAALPARGEPAERLVLPSEPRALHETVIANGWSDGLPVIPPTPALVEALIACGDRDALDVLGVLPPGHGLVTVEGVAVNAAMAGCEPRAFPVVLAAVRAMCAPEFNLKAIQSTTHPCTVACLVGGPVVDAIDLNGAYNAFGQGNRANAAIGRALRLVLVNIGGASPGVLDRSTMGSPAKYAFCFAENTEANPWPSHHEELGLDPGASYVTVFGVEGPHNVNDHYGRDAEEILLTVAGTLASPGANNFYLEGQPVVVLGPEHADVIAAGGFTKAKVREFLSERAIVPRAVVSDAMIDVLAERLPHHLLGARGCDGVRFITEPNDLIVLVAGGAGRHSAILPTFGHSTRAVTRQVE